VAGTTLLDVVDVDTYISIVASAHYDVLYVSGTVMNVFNSTLREGSE
jgi:hypothetical protein